MSLEMHRGGALREVMDGLIRDHGEKWLAFIRRMVGNIADAEDVLQDAVMHVLDRDPPNTSPDEVRMYLRRAIRNTAIEAYHLRRRSRLRDISLEEHLVADAGLGGPLEQLEERERTAELAQLLAWLQEGLRRLPVKQYEALRKTLLDGPGTSIRDAGARSGIPYSTLRHRSVQGLRRLRRYVERARRVASVRAFSF